MVAPLTALQIARALGRSKQAVAKALSGTPSLPVIVEGKEAQGWEFLRLPERIQRELSEAQERGRYRTLGDLIANPPRRWSPQVPIAEISEEAKGKAVRLRDALLPILERQDSHLFSPADQLRAGLENYERAFSQKISTRHWQALFRRTLDRDGGFEDWTRLELYLEERPIVSTAPAAVIHSPRDLESLAVTLRGIRDPQEPSTAEKDALWLAAVELLQPSVGKSNFRQLRKAIIAFLHKEAPWIGKSENAIRKNLDFKLSRAGQQANAALALRDGRTVRAEIRSAESLWPKEDVDLIAWETVSAHGGRAAEAVRALLQLGRLSEPTAARLKDAGTFKSYLPQSLRELVTPHVRAMTAIHQGSRAARLTTPYIERDYSKLASMDMVQADDFTLPVYFYLPGGELTRGQCLVAVDVRSLRILSFVLIPAPQYDALGIRTLFAHTFEEHGIPRTLYLENGIWKRSKIVVGESALRESEPGRSPAEMEQGLRALGIQFIHAQRPQAKVIEKIGDLIQTRMHSIPGYCGREERKDCPEITHRNLAAVQAGRMHPSEHFLSFGEWKTQLDSIFKSYNAERHCVSSRVIPGLSPEEAFEKFWKEPLQIGPEARHLLAHIRKPVFCNQGGIQFKVGRESYRYADAETGRRQGQNLLAWFNPDLPESCTFTNLRGRDPFTVERLMPVGAAGDDPQLEIELGKVRGHAAASRAMYSVLKTKFARKFQRIHPDRPTTELGQRLNTEATSVQSRRVEVTQVESRRAKLARQIGKTPPGDNQRLQHLESFLEMVKETEQS